MQWWFVKHIAPYTSKEILDIMKSSLPDALKSLKPRPRWMSCVAQNEMKHTLAYEYVQKYFADNAKEAVSFFKLLFIINIKIELHYFLIR